jgi:hypothetical protein|tara:strand:+ start:533 stop:775 length:243 start_codon:yes stop_codon:yes gene_type:complete
MEKGCIKIIRKDIFYQNMIFVCLLIATMFSSTILILSAVIDNPLIYVGAVIPIVFYWKALNYCRKYKKDLGEYDDTYKIN